MAHRGAVVVAVVIAEHCYDVRVSLQAHKRRRNQPLCVLAPTRRHHGCTHSCLWSEPEQWNSPRPVGGYLARTLTRTMTPTLSRMSGWGSWLWAVSA